MNDEQCSLEVCPKVVRADRESAITVRLPEDACACEVEVHPTNWPADVDSSAPRLRICPDNGVLHLSHVFEDEQEHVLVVERVSGLERVLLGEVRVYSLKDDLFERWPYKGDLHLHSDQSDGKEPPAHVAAACRRIGFDFMALTDHRLYAPSLDAIKAFEEVEIDLHMYPGEEVHPPGSPVHIVNFGGRFSLHEQFEDEATYRSEVKAIEDVAGKLPAGVDGYQYASSLWCFDKIREAGGLAIFCHPYWFTSNRYYMPEALTTHLLKEQPYDALEVIGGYFRHQVESNALQVARYYEERAQGRDIPIVGVSDAHGCERGELFGWYYTIVFAPSLSLPDLIESIKGLHSVAVEALPGETPRIHGPFRLVKYAHFLLRETFPQHDELCAEEGELMMRHLAGDADAAEALRDRSGRVRALYERMWAGR